MERRDGRDSGKGAAGLPSLNVLSGNTRRDGILKPVREDSLFTVSTDGPVPGNQSPMSAPPRGSRRVYPERMVVYRFRCPLCFLQLHLLRQGIQRRQTFRARLRKALTSHIARIHPGLTARDRSVLADNVAEVEFGDRKGP